MLDFIKTSLYFLTIFGIGFTVLKIIHPKSWLDSKTLPLIYGLGMGSISLQMFLMSLIGLRFSLCSIIVPWVVLVLWVFKKDRIQPRRLTYAVNLRGWVKANPYLLLFFMVTIFLFLLDIMIGLPLLGWDAWANFAFKAKVFYLEKHIPLELYSCRFNIFPLKEYPLLVSLAETFFYNFLGRPDDSLVRVIFYVFYLAILIYFYGFLKDIYGKIYSSLFTFFLAGIPMFSAFAFGYYVGYADLIFIYFSLVSIVSLWLYANKKGKYLLYLSSIFTMFAIWTKMEGMVLLVANLLCIVFFKILDAKNIGMKIRLFSSYLLMPLIVAVVWYEIVMFLSVVSIHSLMDIGFVKYFTRVPVLGGRFLQEAFTFSEWHIFWVFFILLHIFYFNKFFYSRFIRYIYINLMNQFILYGFIIIIDRDFEGVIVNSLGRLMLHLMPLVLIATAGVIYSIDTDGKDRILVH